MEEHNQYSVSRRADDDDLNTPRRAADDTQPGNYILNPNLASEAYDGYSHCLELMVVQNFDPRTKRILINGVVYLPVISRGKQEDADESAEPDEKKRRLLETESVDITITYEKDLDQSWPVELVRVMRDIGDNEE